LTLAGLCSDCRGMLSGLMIRGRGALAFLRVGKELLALLSLPVHASPEIAAWGHRHRGSSSPLIVSALHFVEDGEVLLFPAHQISPMR
jgi:hypothetical protein